MEIGTGLTLQLARATCLLVLATTPLQPAAAHPDTSAKPAASYQLEQVDRDTPATAVDVVNAFHAALRRGDTKAALALMAEAAIIFESGGVERSRTEYESHHLNADAEFSATTSRTPVSQVVAMDGNLSSVMSVDNVTGTFRGRPINSRSVETMVLRKTQGQWRIVHIHWSSANITSK